jgi:L-lactate dehydrogenase complex protein LldG
MPRMGASPGTAHELWSLFTGKAELVGAGVLRADSPTTVRTVLHEARVTRVGHTASLAQAFPDIASQTGAQPIGPPQDVPPDVIALGRTAVAETGSVLLDEPQADRAACFLAERLWLLVAADAVVPTLEQALQHLQTLIEHGSHHPQLVTGPSRTADIERVLTIGVHGPRALMILVIEAHA